MGSVSLIDVLRVDIRGREEVGFVVLRVGREEESSLRELEGRGDDFDGRLVFGLAFYIFMRGEAGLSFTLQLLLRL